MWFMLHVISVTCSVYCPPQEAVSVFGYIEGSFLVSRTGDERERHVPNIYRSMRFNVHLCNHIILLQSGGGT
jgi:hypothetical protein